MTSHNKSLPDISIVNNQNSERAFKIDVETEDGKRILNQTYKIKGEKGGNINKIENQDLNESAKRQSVLMSVRSGQEKKTTRVRTENGGFPPWQEIVIRASRDDELSINASIE